MDEAQVTALINSALETFKTSIMNDVNKSNSGLAANVERTIKKSLEGIQPKTEEPSDDKPANLSLKALEKQIQDLTTQLSEKDKKAFESERTAAISQLIGGSDTINKGLLQKVFSVEYAPKLQKENDKWFLESEGSVIPLNQIFDNYLQTDEGKTFLAPSSVQGSGSRETKSTISNSKAELTLDQQYAALTQNLQN